MVYIRHNNLYLTDCGDVTLQDQRVLDNSNLFVWDGKQVGGVPVRTGTACEPVLLRMTYPQPPSGEGGEGEGEREGEIELGRARDSTLGGLRVYNIHIYCIVYECLCPFL